MLFFGGMLYNYSGRVAELLDESILLRHDNAELIVRLSEEKRAAEAVRDAAQASERAKSAFISNISHELRTPLNAILGMAQLLERSDLAKAQRDHVKVLLEASRGLKTLLDDIIALAQQSGRAAFLARRRLRRRPGRANGRAPAAAQCVGEAPAPLRQYRPRSAAGGRRSEAPSPRAA